MTTYYTQYWSSKWLKAADMDGEIMDHTAGDKFVKMGVAPGDFIYVVTVQRGHLYLLGRMQVGKICSQKEAERVLGTSNLWEGKDHLIARSGTGSPTRFDRQVPIRVVRRLQFESPSGGSKPLKFISNGVLDRQTLRGVRKLTASSAAMLNGILKTSVRLGQHDTIDEVPGEDEVFPEGKGIYRLHKSRERNSKVTEDAKRKRIEKDPLLHCDVCDFSFAATYRQLGQGFLEAHHTVPLSEISGEIQTRIEDIALVCSNCHRMIHKHRPWLNIAEFKQMIKS